METRWQRYHRRRLARLEAAIQAGWYWTRAESGIYQLRLRGHSDPIGEFGSRRSVEQAILESYEETR